MIVIFHQSYQKITFAISEQYTYPCCYVNFVNFPEMSKIVIPIVIDQSDLEIFLLIIISIFKHITNSN
jgi:hypothetical protein